jgi:hypothetical protein
LHPILLVLQGPFAIVIFSFSNLSTNKS